MFPDVFFSLLVDKLFSMTPWCKSIVSVMISFLVGSFLIMMRYLRFSGIVWIWCDFGPGHDVI